MSQIFINGKKAIYSDGSTLADVARDRNLADRGVAMARNGEVVHRQQWHTTTLAENDDILIIKAFCGG
jgi:sulfur carrier protein